MVGVICKEIEREAAKEAFELFKTPWEFFREDCQYEVVVCTSEEVPTIEKGLLIIYSYLMTDHDRRNNISVFQHIQSDLINYKGNHIPIYGGLCTLKAKGGSPLICITGGKNECAALEIENTGCKTVRVGYNLLKEIACLISKGQPIRYAQVPSLEIHLAILRDIIINNGTLLVEIPPVPWAYDFMVCLTHDVDFVKISNHGFDSTVLGFAYRSLFASFFSFVKRKLSFEKMITNWKAALSIPLVYLGFKEDFWWQFRNYLDIEKREKLGSTYFFVPFKRRIGVSNGKKSRNPLRAVKYDFAEVEEVIHELSKNHCEIGVHGIDAWHNLSSAQEELDRVARAVRQNKFGIRMHWLYLDRDSFDILDKAGYAYDSTFGYNETIGFRAGTAQVFRPFNCQNLLELPLHLHDQALFTADKLSLKGQAECLCTQLINHVQHYGGVLTILWHQRSLAPERLWGDFYKSLLVDLKDRNGWITKAIHVVEWFRLRRNIEFSNVALSENKLSLRLGNIGDKPPQPYRLRIHNLKPEKLGAKYEFYANRRYVDVKLENGDEIEVSFGLSGGTS